MQLSATRFIKIDGTNVTANVTSATDAKMAVKEVRQKKREYLHIKKGLARDLKAAEHRAGKTKTKAARAAGVFARLRSALSGLSRAYGEAGAQMDAASLELECARTEEILHNLDAVLIQIQGKLLHRS